jgi:hypothetical protein
MLGSLSFFLLTLLIVLVLGYQTMRLLVRMRRAAQFKRASANGRVPGEEEGGEMLSMQGLPENLPVSAGNPEETPKRPGI